MTNPTIVIVPGSSHSSAHFVPLAKALSTAGFSNILNLTLPSTSTETAAATSFDPDVEHIRSAVIERVERGEDVAIIMHSYGGAPATEAVKGLGREEREKAGKKGGVVRMIYVAAIVLAEGDSVVTNRYNPPTEPKNQEYLANTSLYTFKDGFSRILDGTEWFYNDMTKAEALKWQAELVPQSVGVLQSPLTYSAYLYIPSSFLLCTNDNALPFPSQERSVKGAGIKHTLTLDAGHSPYLSRVNEVVDFVIEAVQIANVKN